MQAPFSVFVRLALALCALLAWAGCSREKRVSRHLQSAAEYVQQGRYDRAEIEYLNVAKLDPRHLDALRGLGEAYLQQGRPSHALPFLARAVERLPNDAALRLAFGQTLLATGHAADATREALRLLEAQPDHDDAAMLLAEAALQPGAITAARRRLLELPNAKERAATLSALATLDLRDRQFKAAQAKAEQAKSLAPDSVLVNSVLGGVYWAANDLAAADTALKAAADAAPVRSPRRLQYIRFKIQNGQFEEARRLLEALGREAPDYLPPSLWLGEIALVEKRFADCAASLQRALARDPGHPEALLLSARLKAASGEIDAALAAFEQFVSSFPNSPQAHFHAATAYLAAGNSRKAAAHLSDAVQLAPGYAEAIVMLAGINVRKGNATAAVIALKPLVQQRPALIAARLLLADAYRAQSNYDEALAVYHAIDRDFTPNAQTPLLIGLVHLQQRHPELARREFVRALQLSPGFLPAVEQLVNLDLAEAKPAAAKARVDAELATRPKEAGLQLLSARVATAEQRDADAEQALLRAIELQPDFSGAYFLLAQHYLDAKQHDRAVAQLEQMLQLRPKDVTALMLLAQIDAQKKAYAAARGRYEAVLAIDPNFVPALNNLAYLCSEHLGQLDRAYELARRARELRPADAHAADTLAWVLYQRGEHEWAASLLEESAPRLPGSAEVWFHLAMVHYAQGNETPARRAFERVLEIEPAFARGEEVRQRLNVLRIDPATVTREQRLQLQRQYGAATTEGVVLARVTASLEREGARAKAIELYEALLRAQPTNVTAQLRLAELQARDGDLAEAMDLAKAARKQDPSSPRVARVLGRLALRLGDAAWAVSLLDEAARHDADNAEAQLDLALGLCAVGRTADAAQAIEEALAMAPDSPRVPEAQLLLAYAAGSPASLQTGLIEAQRQLATPEPSAAALLVAAAQAETNGQFETALQHYRRLLAAYPTFAPAQRRIALTAPRDAAVLADALAAGQAARNFYPEDAELARAVGILLYRSGDFTRAVRLLRDSANRAPQDGELLVYLGIAQSRLNDRANSRLTLARALQGTLPDDLAAEARRTLVQLDSSLN